jgi:hypothetical protein
MVRVNYTRLYVGDLLNKVLLDALLNKCKKERFVSVLMEFLTNF